LFPPEWVGSLESCAGDGGLRTRRHVGRRARDPQTGMQVKALEPACLRRGTEADRNRAYQFYPGMLAAPRTPPKAINNVPDQLRIPLGTSLNIFIFQHFQKCYLFIRFWSFWVVFVFFQFWELRGLPGRISGPQTPTP